MNRSKSKRTPAFLDNMLGEASWLISHADALEVYKRKEEAAAEWGRAAACEEQVASLLEADGQENEAAIHRVSAASCLEKIGQYVRAVTLLRAALSTELPSEYLARVKRQHVRCLAHVRKELSRAGRRARKKSSAIT
jgi:hypothetical protein